MRRAPTRFARSGDARIAYQIFGDGPVHLVVTGGPASHLDLQWDEPSTVRLFERFASFARLVLFDRRGTGLWDPTKGPPTLEQEMEDLDTVMDAAGLTRAALIGAVDAGLCARPGSRFILERGSRRSPAAARCRRQARSRTWSWARSCASPIAEPTRCAACPASGESTRWRSSAGASSLGRGGWT